MGRRKKSNPLGWIIPCLVTIGISIFYTHGGCTPPYGANATTHGKWGNLEKVITYENIPEQIVNYEGMTISFNPEAHIPNWVAWELTGTETLGDEQRSDKFQRDSNVKGCPSTEDYRNSGYDRGHMAPAGDMKWSRKAMDDSFYLTNICPQHKSLNTGAWKKLEEKCRLWAKRDSALIIVCGPVLTEHAQEYIGETEVHVPKNFFKVILAPYANPPRTIGFIMNNGRVEGGMQRAAVSVNEVERITGHDFFSELPDSIEESIESECKFNYWSSLK